MTHQLQDGNRVCIIGGGPAGCFSALHLLRLARRQKLRLEVLIFEARDFSQLGPAGCNRCAGILSSRLVQSLEELDISLPASVVEAELNAYAIHLDGEILRIERPDPRRRIVSVYRGGGPRLAQPEPGAGFDGFILATACQRGAQHISERVRLVSKEGEQVVVQTNKQRLTADLVVLASGVNSRPTLDPVFGYEPPPTAIMAQDEFLRPATWPADQVGAFFREPPGLSFGVLIPKGPYLNVSLLGEGLRLRTIDEFLDVHGLTNGQGVEGKSLCGCTPRIAVGPARNYFGDHWVAVGDAAATRLFKDGIGSAFFSARAAMETALTRGISGRAFAAGYASHCRAVSRDNRYGRLLFSLWRQTLRRPILLQAWKRAISLEAGYPLPQRIHTRILWGMLTGDESYHDLFWLSTKPAALWALLSGFRPTPFRYIVNAEARRNPTRP